jgi:ATPase subunit of ABC transporter with duplicated ATPase domains
LSDAVRAIPWRLAEQICEVEREIPRLILNFLMNRGDTVFLDEPDNFISLREIQPWLLAAEEAVEDHSGQLILISHHPETLNQWASSRLLN